MTEEEFLQMYRAQKAEQKAADPDLSIPEMILGTSRSYLAGPTFNFNDNIEAAITAALTDNTYDEELALIRDQQDRFKRKAGYADDAVELVSGVVLNPLDKLGKVARAGGLLDDGANLAARAIASAPSQAAIASAGAADGEDVLKKAVTGAAIGTGASAVSSMISNFADDASRGADKLKLDAYGLTNAQVQKSLNNLKAVGAEVDSAERLPLLNTLKILEQRGVINPADDVLENAAKVKVLRDQLGTDLHIYIDELDKVIPKKKDWSWNNLFKEIDTVSGHAKDQAEAIAQRELLALEKQIKEGSLSSMQRAKMGLRFTGKEDPAVGGAVIDAIRRDLKEAIEGRINAAAQDGIIDPENLGLITKLNRQWGDIEDLYSNLYAKGAGDLRGNLADDLLQNIRTSGGTGSLNIASAASGNPIWAALGKVVDQARAPEVKSDVADWLMNPIINKTLKTTSDVLDEYGNARNAAQIYSSISEREGGREKERQTPSKYTGQLGTGEERSSKSESQESASSKNGSANPGATQPAMTEKEFLELYRRSKGAKGEQVSLKNDPDNIDLALNALYGSPDPDMQLGGVSIEDIVRAVAAKESAGNPNALSPKGAYGLMQLMPGTAKELGVDINDPIENIIGGTKYLVQNFDPNDGLDALDLMLARYNAGPGAVQRYSGIPPFEETKEYVNTIRGKLKGKSRNDFSSNAVIAGGSTFG